MKRRIRLEGSSVPSIPTQAGINDVLHLPLLSKSVFVQKPTVGSITLNFIITIRLGIMQLNLINEVACEMTFIIRHRYVALHFKIALLMDLFFLSHDCFIRIRNGVLCDTVRSFFSVLVFLIRGHLYKYAFTIKNSEN